MRCLLLLTGLLALCGCSPRETEAAGAKTLSINGSTTVHPIMEKAARILREEAGLQVTVDVQGGSGGGIAQVAEGRVDIGTSSRPLSEADEKRWPDADLRPVVIGYDAVALAVSTAVFEGGVRALDRNQVRAIFEGRIDNWSQVGGPDAPIFVYDKEPGRGTREVFESWAYPKGEEPPLVSFERYAQVGGNEEGAAKAGAHDSAVTLLSASWVGRREELRSVAIVDDRGQPIEPTMRTIEDGSYPLVRPLLVLTAGSPSSIEQELLSLLCSEPGSTLVEECGYAGVSSTSVGVTSAE